MKSLENEEYLVKLNDIGNVSWSDNDIRREFDNFEKIYKSSPVKDNSGGMKSPHAFAT